jgi:hypothetical protein
VEQTESALAGGTSLVIDSGFRDLGLFPETSVPPRFIIDCVLEDCVLEDCVLEDCVLEDCVLEIR